MFHRPASGRSFHGKWDLTRVQALEALAHYRAYYEKQGIFENVPYAGIHSLLTRLKEAGARLYVATSKPEPSSLKILERFELLPYFDGVAESLLNETRTKRAKFSNTHWNTLL